MLLKIPQNIPPILAVLGRPFSGPTEGHIVKYCNSYFVPLEMGMGQYIGQANTMIYYHNNNILFYLDVYLT